MVHEVESKEDFDKQLADAGEKLVIVDFYATWCNPCKNIAPYLDELSIEFKDKVVFIKVNVDELDEIVTNYNVEVMPTFVCLRRGAHLDTFVGANKEKLRMLVEKHLG